jgi:hypothetical protein
MMNRLKVLVLFLRHHRHRHRRSHLRKLARVRRWVHRRCRVYRFLLFLLLRLLSCPTLRALVRLCPSLQVVRRELWGPGLWFLQLALLALSCCNFPNVVNQWLTQWDGGLAHVSWTYCLVGIMCFDPGQVMYVCSMWRNVIACVCNAEFTNAEHLILYWLPFVSSDFCSR